MVPWKPLPTVVPVTSTIWPALNMSTLSSPPVASSSPSPLLKRNSCEVYPAATFALAKWPGSALVTREGRRLPMVTWTARYPSALSFLTCEMRFGNASTTVTGTVTPASVNTRVMPHLRPTRPMVIVNPHTARRWELAPLSSHSLQSAGGLGNGPQLPVGEWRRRPRAPTSKMDGGLYTNPPCVQV